MRLFDVTRRVPMRVVAPGSVALDSAREAALDAFLWEHRARVDAIGERISSMVAQRSLARGDAVDALALELLREHRRSCLRDPSLRAAAAIDAVVRTQRGEIMDQPWVPAWMRRLEMRTLDRVNVEIGSYAAWARAIERATHRTSVNSLMDLAAGSAGFFRYLAREGVARRNGWSLVATDIERTYVEQGALACEREGSTDVLRCEVRSAVELEALRGSVDLFVCTQALHHMPPGLVLRVIAGAIRSAPQGIVLIDLARGAALAAMTGVVLSAVARVPFVVFDGVRSVRRAYLPTELALLARLAGSTFVEARWDAPAHHVVHAALR